MAFRVQRFKKFFILEVIMNESDILAKGKKAFLDELMDQVRRFDDPYTTDEAIQIFHKIKGGAGFFGLNEIKEAASKIEKEAKRGDLRDNNLREFLSLCLSTITNQTS